MAGDLLKHVIKKPMPVFTAQRPVPSKFRRTLICVSFVLREMAAVRINGYSLTSLIEPERAPASAAPVLQVYADYFSS